MVPVLRSEIEAENLENKAKAELNNKNYELALKFFKEAKILYLQLNFRGKIAYIEKQLAQLNRVIEFEKKKEKKLEIERKRNEDIADEERKKAIEIEQQKLAAEAKERKGRIFEAEKEENARESHFTQVDMQRAKIREQTRKNELNFEYEKIRDKKIESREEQRELELKEREKALKLKAEEAKKENKLEDKADWALEQAKMAIKYKNFRDAKVHYKEAIDLFKELGWFDQVGILYDEIKNVDKYELEHLRKLEQAKLKKKLEKEDFQKRVDDTLAEKKQEEQKRLEILKSLPPEIKEIMEKANMLKLKAQKEENVNIKRALGRYQYILDLLESIPSDKINLTNEISEVNKKIEELQLKM